MVKTSAPFRSIHARSIERISQKDSSVFNLYAMNLIKTVSFPLNNVGESNLRARSLSRSEEFAPKFDSVLEMPLADQPSSLR